MEIGFVLAIIGIIVVLIATIWYFAAELNTLLNVAQLGDNPVKNSSGTTLTRTTGGTTITLTGNNILLKEAVSLVGPSPVAIGGWVIGAIMIIGGTIWGIISRSRSKPDSRTAQLLQLLSIQQAAAKPAAVAVASPVPAARPISTAPAGGLTAEELARLKVLLAATAT